jgi:hypothetical protein
MTRDTCRYPTCKRSPGAHGGSYRARRFCSPLCAIKYEHVQADAREARRQEGQR